MGEWMPATVHVSVPDDADLDPWLHRTTDRYGYGRVVLAAPGDALAPPPIRDLLATARTAGFEWEWEPDRRLLSDGGGDLEVNYGLNEWFTDLASLLRAAGWGYHFESSGKYELPGECWEWMPGWPAERTFVQSGESKALDADGLRAALDEAGVLGIDTSDHLDTMLQPWPGWTAPTA